MANKKSKLNDKIMGKSTLKKANLKPIQKKEIKKKVVTKTEPKITKTEVSKKDINKKATTTKIKKDTSKIKKKVVTKTEPKITKTEVSKKDINKKPTTTKIKKATLEVKKEGTTKPESKKVKTEVAKKDINKKTTTAKIKKDTLEAKKKELTKPEPKKARTKIIKKETTSVETKNKGVRFKKLKNTKIKIKEKLTIKIGAISKRNLKKIFIISICLIVILIGIIYFVKENPTGLLNIYKEYKIGDTVTLGEKNNWYVIEDSDSHKEKVKIISEKPLDLNKDGKLNDKDKVTFDKNGDCELDASDDNNIAFLLKSVYVTRISNVSEISKITLLTSEEYIKIRNAMGYDYTWKKGNWLASSAIGAWWIGTSNNNKVYAVNPNGSYRLESPKKKYFVRPVIVIYKTSIN